MGCIPEGETSDLILNTATTDTEDEDPVENFRRALAKSEIKMSTAPAMPVVATPMLPPATPLSRPPTEHGLITPPSTRSPQSILRAAVPEFVPSSGPSSPESPFANLTYQYPHLVVVQTLFENAHPPLPFPALTTETDHTPFDVADHALVQETDLRAYCWHRYGLNIEDIRMDGLAALPSESTEPCIQTQEKAPAAVETGKLDVWNILDEAVRVEKAAEEQRIQEVQLVTTPEPSTFFDPGDTPTASDGEEVAEVSGATPSSIISTPTLPCLTTETSPSGDNIPAGDNQTPVERSDIANNLATYISDDANDDFVDPEDVWYAQLYADTSMEVEVIMGRSEKPLTSPIADNVCTAAGHDAANIVGETKQEIHVDTNVGPDASLSQQHGSDPGEAITHNGPTDTIADIAIPTNVHEPVDAHHEDGPVQEVQDEFCITHEHITDVCEPVNAYHDDSTVQEVQEELHIVHEHITNVSEPVTVRSSDSEAADISHTNVEVGTEAQQRTKHMWLKLALLPVLDYYSMRLLSKFFTHPLAFFLLFVSFIILKQRG
jgi:hypothetical protein